MHECYFTHHWCDNFARIPTSTIMWCARPHENTCDDVAAPVSEYPTSKHEQAVVQSKQINSVNQRITPITSN